MHSVVQNWLDGIEEMIKRYNGPIWGSNFLTLDAKPYSQSTSSKRLKIIKI